jgi:hypothetical protein
VFSGNLKRKIIPVDIRCPDAGKDHFVHHEGIEGDHPIAVGCFYPISFEDVSPKKITIQLLSQLLPNGTFVGAEKIESCHVLS